MFDPMCVYTHMEYPVYIHTHTLARCGFPQSIVDGATAECVISFIVSDSYSSTQDPSLSRL